MIQKRSQAGLSMIEVIIASVILVAVIAMAFGLLMTASDATSNQGNITSMEEKLQIVLNQITADLRNSGGVYTLSAPTQNGDAFYDASATGLMSHHSSLMFGLNNGFQVTGVKGNTGAAIYTNDTVRYYWRIEQGELLNGLDDDSDGWIDEGVVVRWEEKTDPATGLKSSVESTICHDIPRRGLTFRFPSAENPPRSVTLNFQIMARDATQGKDAVDKRQKTVTRQATRIVSPRG